MVVKLMVDYSAALKPLVLAAMFVACLEFWVDRFEYCIVWLCRALFMRCRRCKRQPEDNPTDLELPLASPLDATPNRAHAPTDEPLVLKYGLVLARPLAVVATLCGLILSLAALSMSLVSSVRRVDLGVYKQGALELQRIITHMFKRLDPDTQQQLIDHLKSMSDQLGGLAASCLNKILDASSGFLAQALMFLIYVLMWLLVPMRWKGGQQMFKIVRTFFALKAACNTCFAILAFVLLEWLDVDLAVLIAVLMFVLGFIPEVGVFLGLLLPVPVILLDSRVSLMVRFGRLAWAAGGLLLIKFAVSNGLESLVMGRNPTLAGMIRDRGEVFEETHPVIVLFVVVLLGEIWGPTGMLVSVPLISMVRLTINLESAHDKDSNRHE